MIIWIRGSHSSNYAVVVMPCRLIGVQRRFGRTYCLHILGRRVSQARKRQHAGCKQNRMAYCFGYFYTLKVEAGRSYEMSVYLYRITKRCKPEYRTKRITVEKGCGYIYFGMNLIGELSKNFGQF
jgi:hypothetical protein